MAREFIITMTASNRSGILAAVTKAMADLGADLREASQTVVRGFFTMIFSAEFPDEVEAGIIRDHLMDSGRPFGIEIGVKEASTGQAVDSAATPTILRVLRLGGRNRPGVLRKLSSVLAMRRIDITGMHAVRATDSAGFEVIMKVAIPQQCNLDDVTRELQNAGQEFECTAEFQEMKS